MNKVLIKKAIHYSVLAIFASVLNYMAIDYPPANLLVNGAVIYGTIKVKEFLEE